VKEAQRKKKLILGRFSRKKFHVHYGRILKKKKYFMCSFDVNWKNKAIASKEEEQSRTTF
jgi:hypothetical protein